MAHRSTGPAGGQDPAGNCRRAVTTLFSSSSVSSHRPPSSPISRVPALDAVLTSLGLVFLAEMGDKTQLLALILATRFKKPWPIIAGMLVAVLANHALAGGLGLALADHLPADWLRWGVAASFVAMARWMLVPDTAPLAEKIDARRNAFATALVAFFIAEMGDKTQIATITLAARYHSLGLVMIGSSLGMLAADAPVIFLGERIVRWLPARLARQGSAALFAAFGVATVAGW
jgi:putative Ca2+/H+ antiporter (TMEM165/GDT1 family)